VSANKEVYEAVLEFCTGRSKVGGWGRIFHSKYRIRKRERNSLELCVPQSPYEWIHVRNTHQKKKCSDRNDFLASPSHNHQFHAPVEQTKILPLWQQEAEKPMSLTLYFSLIFGRVQV
jgi:hypothetical protein